MNPSFRPLAVVTGAIGLILASACSDLVALTPIGANSPSAFVEDVTALRPIILRDEAATAEYLAAFPLSAYRLRPSSGIGNFYIDSTGDVIKNVLDAGLAWEPDIRDLLLEHIGTGTSVLDIGAHVGTHTVTMGRAVGSHGHVFAFEPQMKLFRELSENLAVNQIGNVTPLRFALGDGESRVVEMN